MRDFFKTSSLRTQFLLIVIGAAVIPLGFVALWLTSSGVHSGERLLVEHLDESAKQFVAAINRRWEFRRGFLLFLADNAVTTAIAARSTVSAAETAFLDQAMAEAAGTIPMVEIADVHGSVLWSSATGAASPLTNASPANAARGELPPLTFTVLYRIPADSTRPQLGSIRANVALSGLIPPDSARPIVPGARLGVRESASGQTLVSLDRDLAFTEDARVTIRGEVWFTTRRVSDAGLEILLAAPLTPYVGPSRDAGRVGIILLLLVGCTALALTVVLTTRVTRPLRDLADAADAVSRGELNRQVATGGPIEVRRVGGAFNVMTESLRSTLEALTQRNAMAAVGEFAAALSHDVRNALTLIKVDVERTAHRPMDEAQGSAVLRRVLNNVARLDSLVSGALRLARGKQMALVDIDVRRPVRAAAEIVAGAFAAVPATLSIETLDEPVVASGDAVALEQLLANVLFNAAQAVRPGGGARIRILRDNGALVIEVADDGIGMDEAQIARLDLPFHSTKSNGTGLGLPIARQIAAAHGGELLISSQPGQGTVVRLRLPQPTHHARPGQ